MLSRPLVIAAITATAVLGVAACGGSEDADYVDSVNEVTSQLQGDVSEITSGAKVDSPQQAAALFTEVSGKVDTASPLYLPKGVRAIASAR